jgi:hypothetical protein
MKKLIRTTALLIAACATSAFAVPTLTISDNLGNTVSIMDGGAGDACPQLGCVTWIGSIGVWDINVDTGLTKPITGNPNHLDMDLAFAAHSTRGGMLTINFSDDGFMVSGVGVDGVGGTTAGTVVDNIRVNGGIVMSQGPFGPGAFSGTVSGPMSLNPADLIGIEVVINHNGAGSSTGDKHMTVPEGGSAVALLGMAIVGLEGLRRKIRARKS